jgi:flagellin
VTKSSTERADYQSEFATLAGYITDTATKSFNGVSLFGGAALAVTTDGQGTKFSMTGINLSAAAYTTATGGNISTTTGAVTALTNVTAAIAQLGTDTATVGADTERLTYTSSELNVLSDNLSAANSAIADVDVATESTKYAADQILVQSGVSMLAQANSAPQSVLKLLQ